MHAFLDRKHRSCPAVLVAIFILVAVCSSFATSRPCPGGVGVSAFKLLVKGTSGAPIPVTAVNMLTPGQTLRYEPARIPAELKNKAKVAVVLVSSKDTDSAQPKLQVLQEHPASVPAEWRVPARASVVGLVFGERGVDEKKLNNLVQKDPAIISDLTDYAQRTATVEALVQTLAEYEKSAPGSSSLQAALHGFSSQYGVTLPKMDPSTPADQQAAMLMRAVVPAVSTNNPTPTRNTIAEQSTGLAANVGSLFLGTPVTLAVASAALAENLHTSLFPATDFRPAFTQSSSASAGAMDLCTARQDKKAHTKLAYLWMIRVPDADAPEVSIPELAHVPVGWESTVKVSAASVAQLKLLPRAHDWKLVSKTGETPIPVKPNMTDSGATLALDLRHAKLAPGDYKLVATWDWSPLQVAGTIEVHPLGDIAAATLTPDSQDRLVAWTGTTSAQLTGADFEFVDKVTIAPETKSKSKSSSDAPISVPFTLPKGPAAGEQRSLDLDIDTSVVEPGPHLLSVRQVNGATSKLPVTVHRPLPKLDRLPIKVNVGQPEQTIELRGTGLERIERITSPNATWALSPVSSDAHDLTVRQATVKLDSLARKGDVIPAQLFIANMHAPVSVASALEVLGPRPRIVTARTSFASASAVQLRDNEIPAGSPASFAIAAENLDGRPQLDLRCASDRDQKQSLTLSPGTRQGSASLDLAGSSDLFLSLDPGTIGQSGCALIAQIKTANSGDSDPYHLGRIIELPRIESFSVSDEKLGDSLYAGTLTGQNLQLIEKTGWDAKTGQPVQAIPTPVPSNPQQQTLKIAVPWPSPSPRAPLYIWLRGETEARATNARY